MYLRFLTQVLVVIHLTKFIRKVSFTARLTQDPREAVAEKRKLEHNGVLQGLA